MLAGRNPRRADPGGGMAARITSTVLSSIVSFVVLSAMLAIIPTAETDVATAQQRDEATQVREVAERFLATSAGYGPPGAVQTAHLYAGSLPPQSGFDLPLPPGSQ